jgi:hypothetical protein
VKIEHKGSTYECCKKGNPNTGNINHAWRAVHKKARTVWKEAVFQNKWDDLVKRI